MRSKLFVPGSRVDVFPKALASDADALSFDLEDAVTLDKKDEARAAVAAFLKAVPSYRTQKIMVVRINGARSPQFSDDIRAVAQESLDLLNVPMVESADDIRAASAALAEAEKASGLKRRIGILANIETPRGLRYAAEIAGADPRVAALQIGYADLFEPNGVDRTYQPALDAVRMAVRMAAAEAGLPAYDGACPNVADREVFQREAEDARRQGFAGKSCIHPSQVPLANAIFVPSSAQVARARRIVAAADDALRKGVGAFVVDGQLFDGPLVESARALVALADQHKRTTR